MWIGTHVARARTRPTGRSPRPTRRAGASSASAEQRQRASRPSASRPSPPLRSTRSTTAPNSTVNASAYTTAAGRPEVGVRDGDDDQDRHQQHRRWTSGRWPRRRRSRDYPSRAAAAPAPADRLEDDPERRREPPRGERPAGDQEHRQREHDHGGAAERREQRLGIGRGVANTPDGIRRTPRGSGRRRRRCRPARRARRRRSGPPSTAPASQPTSVLTPITTRVTTISRAPASAGGNARRAAGSIGAEHSGAACRELDGLCDSESRLSARKSARLCRKLARARAALGRLGDLAALGARELLAPADERVRELHDLEQVDDVDRRGDREHARRRRRSRRSTQSHSPCGCGWHEPRRERGERERQAPAVEVDDRPPLREADGLEAVVQVLRGRRRRPAGRA